MHSKLKRRHQRHRGVLLRNNNTAVILDSVLSPCPLPSNFIVNALYLIIHCYLYMYTWMRTVCLKSVQVTGVGVSRFKRKEILVQVQLLKSSSVDTNLKNHWRGFSVKIEGLWDKMSTEKKLFQRLPTDICPYHYQISLKPDLKNFICEGEESIHVDVSREFKILYFISFIFYFTQFVFLFIRTFFTIWIYLTTKLNKIYRNHIGDA